jgi:2-hydroxy-6-oxonona-2,4-dienedioate hydrolase
MGTADPLTLRWDVVAGRRMFSRAGGEGAPVVLVHGYGVSSAYLLPLARVLADRCAVHVPDLPGHGRSEDPESPPTIESHAATLAEWLDAVGLERPAFVGNSMGCQVVTELAARRPERVGPILLSGPTVDPRRRSARRQAFGALRDSIHEPVRLGGLAARDGIGWNYGHLRAAARSVLADRMEDRLPSISQRTIVLHGERDGFVSREWAEQVARLLPSGRLVVVPGEPHAVPLTQPGLVADLVCELVAQEVDHAPRERVGRLPHGDVSTREPDESGVREEPGPLFGDPRRQQSVAFAPDQ